MQTHELFATLKHKFVLFESVLSLSSISEHHYTIGTLCLLVGKPAIKFCPVNKLARRQYAIFKMN